MSDPGEFLRPRPHDPGWLFSYYPKESAEQATPAEDELAELVGPELVERVIELCSFCGGGSRSLLEVIAAEAADPPEEYFPLNNPERAKFFERDR